MFVLSVAIVVAQPEKSSPQPPVVCIHSRNFIAHCPRSYLFAFSNCSFAVSRKARWAASRFCCALVFCCFKLFSYAAQSESICFLYIIFSIGISLVHSGIFSSHILWTVAYNSSPVFPSSSDEPYVLFCCSSF